MRRLHVHRRACLHARLWPGVQCERTAPEEACVRVVIRHQWRSDTWRYVCVWSFDTNGVLIPGGMCVWSFDAIGFPIPGGMCVRARVAFRPLPVFDELVLCNDEDGWGVEIPTRKCLPSV